MQHHLVFLLDIPSYRTYTLEVKQLLRVATDDFDAVRFADGNTVEPRRTSAVGEIFFFLTPPFIELPRHWPKTEFSVNRVASNEGGLGRHTGAVSPSPASGCMMPRGLTLPLNSGVG